MILTVTLNPAVDHTLRVDGDLTADTVHRTANAQFDPGGKGINVSKYLVGLGAETVATGPVGGFTGRYLRDRLTAGDLRTDFVSIDGTTRLNTTVLADEEEYKVNHRGPRVSDGVVEELIETVASYAPQLVVVAGSLPSGVGPEAIDRIASRGEWDTAVDVPGSTIRRLEAAYALCKPNRPELAAATGKPVDSLDGCLDAARELQSRGFGRVVASLGVDGAVMATPEGVMHASALDVDVVDTVGAGDALLAGVLAALQDGCSDERALRVGVSVAARAVSVSGTAVPDAADLTVEPDDVRVSVR